MLDVLRTLPASKSRPPSALGLSPDQGPVAAAGPSLSPRLLAAGLPGAAGLHASPEAVGDGAFIDIPGVGGPLLIAVVVVLGGPVRHQGGPGGAEETLDDVGLGSRLHVVRVEYSAASGGGVDEVGPLIRGPGVADLAVLLTGVHVGRCGRGWLDGWGCWLCRHRDRLSCLLGLRGLL